MGIDRNRALDEMPTRKRHWSDDDTCPYYLCGYCPYDLFVNTKSDLGDCGFVHDNAVREECVAVARDPLNSPSSCEN